jgi:hypothetical protein
VLGEDRGMQREALITRMETNKGRLWLLFCEGTNPDVPDVTHRFVARSRVSQNQSGSSATVLYVFRLKVTYVCGVD